MGAYQPRSRSVLDTLPRSASSLLNILTLQWGQVACCQYLVRPAACIAHVSTLHTKGSACGADNAMIARY